MIVPEKNLTSIHDKEVYWEASTIMQCYLKVSTTKLKNHVIYVSFGTLIKPDFGDIRYLKSPNGNFVLKKTPKKPKTPF